MSETVLRQVPGTDLRVNPYALDGSVFGWETGVAETARALDTFADAGGNLVSTADHYAGGRSEVMIGSWLKTMGDRSRAVIATKIGRHPDAPGLSSRMIIKAAEASLQRLDTEYIDLLSLDGEDPETPIDETLEAIDMLRRAGKVRYLGASRFSAARIREINELAEPAVYPTIQVVASVYNLMQRGDYEKEMARVVHELGIGTLVRLPLASGFLTGAFRDRDDVPASPMFADAVTHRGRRGSRVLEALDAISAETGESIGRIAMAWVLTKPNVVAAATRVGSSEQLDEVLTGGEILLTRQQVATLDHASA